LIIIDTVGQYQFIEGTKTLETSDHPVFQAQVELNLRQGQWIGAPGSGHNLPVRSKLSDDDVESYRKELRFYLTKYDPDIREAAIKRASAVIPVIIREDAFNG